uniref:Dermonecrotic toxin LiSicTox-alphaIA2bi n=1 Tax=Loxosceles intermedia TaxID=58218 RepID=A1IB1_LOXIN|nr:RecName: Full=Dermonecrotic toxin LiSicTox-alphaIA2bi; AltName: Full=Loxtox i1; AltName: Full=Phospholipase D; Short=PLD; AltName: Full=Sphingomyelin phosphodiesterase D; Short=SMD; Short=SMase D; Short=Sphingomyelinase D; Flags: Precursor [Loxosceles intermedia]ABU43329.1 loxtox i1 [Loxosceles intermedia]
MLPYIALILVCWSVLSQAAQTDVEGRADKRRPIWIMGHMVNAIAQIDEFVNLGANSIETDVSFDDNANPEYTYHGVPCDCGRSCLKWENFNDFLKGLRSATTPGNAKYQAKLILVVFDLKTGSLYDNQANEAGKKLAKNLLKHYWNNGNNGGRAYIVLSIPDLNHYPLIKGFKDQLTQDGHPELMDKVGHDFSGNDAIGDVGNAYKKAGISGHVWQSDGITNCLLRGLDRVKQAIANRDSGNGFINKVYYWTVDKRATTRDALDAGVDGVMTNYPDVITDVLNESAYKNKFRVASYEDNPWETFKK